ncbi:hypothetical protein [Leptothoe sp. PORK10 BA2]|uniref:hypothetical protein n=1 Tax=Leptothoe sp. PORK10 BA2 TaxID=3110254 RepID=UPI002B207B3E|nr:hypothetical protein [Leptothoe sp. PORK10 BA2]MEA5465920.1 hypothetical protein [Leptothoe sp. PORK10 BA2]
MLLGKDHGETARGELMRQIWPWATATIPGIPLAYPVFAHSGELHGQPTPETAAPDDHIAADDADLAAQDLNTEASTLAESAAVVSEPVMAKIGPTVGLGEALLGLIIVLPWLLMVLRKQLHPQPRP